MEVAGARRAPLEADAREVFGERLRPMHGGIACPVKGQIKLSHAALVAQITIPSGILMSMS